MPTLQLDVVVENVLHPLHLVLGLLDFRLRRRKVVPELVVPKAQIAGVVLEPSFRLAYLGFDLTGQALIFLAQFHLVLLENRNFLLEPRCVDVVMGEVLPQAADLPLVPLAQLTLIVYQHRNPCLHVLGADCLLGDLLVLCPYQLEKVFAECA